VLAACSLSIFLGGLDSTIVTIGLPEIGRWLHAGVSGLQWAADAYTVTLASLLMTSGAAADRLGRRAVLQAGLSLFVLGSWLCSLAPSLGCLIAFRVVQGAGASGMNPAALGIITNVYTDPARRARALGVWDAAYGLSMVTGPVAGGILVGMAGWRAVFWASIPAGLAALALTGLFAPESRAPAARRADPAGQVLVTVMLAALAAAIIQGPAWGWLSWRTTVLLAAVAGALGGLACLEPRRADPLIQLGLFRSTRFNAAMASGVCGIAALSGFSFLSALYLQDVRGMSALNAGLTIGPMAAEMAVCAPLAGRLIARCGARVPAVAAGTALAASSAALTRLTGVSSCSRPAPCGRTGDVARTAWARHLGAPCPDHMGMVDHSRVSSQEKIARVPEGMNVTDDSGANDSAKYSRLAAEIRTWLDSGMFEPGEAVPSITDLAAERAWSRQTCARALQALAREGRLTFYPGLGYHVNESPQE
jgi:EmrB/QacA subfamily drug resistance transporter